MNGEFSSSVMVQESTWRKEAIAAKVGKRSYFHCQPITACVDVRRASLKISLKSDPVHLKLHPPVSLIAPVELYMKPKIFPAPGGGLGYNSTGAITGVKRYTPHRIGSYIIFLELLPKLITHPRSGCLERNTRFVFEMNKFLSAIL